MWGKRDRQSRSSTAGQGTFIRYLLYLPSINLIPYTHTILLHNTDAIQQPGTPRLSAQSRCTLRPMRRLKSVDTWLMHLNGS